MVASAKLVEDSGPSIEEVTFSVFGIGWLGMWNEGSNEGWGLAASGRSLRAEGRQLPLHRLPTDGLQGKWQDNIKRQMRT